MLDTRMARSHGQALLSLHLAALDAHEEQLLYSLRYIDCRVKALFDEHKAWDGRNLGEHFVPVLACKQDHLSGADQSRQEPHAALHKPAAPGSCLLSRLC